jgi:hypothetical protein
MTHGHLPEMHGVADFAHDIFYKIEIADGNAAGGNNHIGMQSGFKFFLQITFFIFGNSQHDRYSAAFQHLRRQGITVAVDNFTQRRIGLISTSSSPVDIIATRGF